MDGPKATVTAKSGIVFIGSLIKVTGIIALIVKKIYFCIDHAIMT